MIVFSTRPCVEGWEHLPPLYTLYDWLAALSVLPENGSDVQNLCHGGGGRHVENN
jgi:hypothetical protein